MRSPLPANQEQRLIVRLDAVRARRGDDAVRDLAQREMRRLDQHALDRVDPELPIARVEDFGPGPHENWRASATANHVQRP